MANRLALCISNLPKESLLRMLEEMRIHGTPEARLAPPPVFAEKSPGRLLTPKTTVKGEEES
jgi:hypothetical protein